MINEDYCSEEVSKLLQEKGFKEPCTGLNKLLCKDGEKPVLRITHQMAMKWLREVHGLIISIEFQIICPTWKWRIYIKSSNDKHTDFRHYNKYEKAVEAALKYVLENLI